MDNGINGINKLHEIHEDVLETKTAVLSLSPLVSAINNLADKIDLIVKDKNESIPVRFAATIFGLAMLGVIGVKGFDAIAKFLGSP